MRKMRNDFVRDAKALGKSVKAVFAGDKATAADKKRAAAAAAGMAGAGGLSGRRRDSARAAYIEDAVGTPSRKK